MSFGWELIIKRRKSQMGINYNKIVQLLTAFTHQQQIQNPLSSQAQKFQFRIYQILFKHINVLRHLIRKTFAFSGTNDCQWVTIANQIASQRQCYQQQSSILIENLRIFFIQFDVLRKLRQKLTHLQYLYRQFIFKIYTVIDRIQWLEQNPAATTLIKEKREYIAQLAINLEIFHIQIYGSEIDIHFQTQENVQQKQVQAQKTSDPENCDE